MLKPRKNNFIIVLILSITLLFILFILADEIRTIGRKEVQVSFKVANNPGFDLNDSALTFGSIPPGQSATRSLFITNEFERKVKVVIKIKGEIEKYLYVSENNFFLEPKEGRKVNFTVILPDNIPLGERTGIIEVRFNKI